MKKFEKYITEGKKYPSQYSAEAVAELTNFLNNKFSTSGSDAIIRKKVAQIDKIRMELWDFAFGDKSPWKPKRGKNYNVKPEWDDKKAEKLGL